MINFEVLWQMIFVLKALVQNIHSKEALLNLLPVKALLNILTFSAVLSFLLFLEA